MQNELGTGQVYMSHWICLKQSEKSFGGRLFLNGRLPFFMPLEVPQPMVVGYITRLMGFGLMGLVMAMKPQF